MKIPRYKLQFPNKNQIPNNKCKTVWDFEFGNWCLFVSCFLFLGICTFISIPAFAQEGALTALTFSGEGQDIVTKACSQGVAIGKSAKKCERPRSEFTHQITWGEGELYLVGSDTGPKAQTGYVSEVLDKFVAMQRTAFAGKMDDYFKGFTEHGHKKHRDWFKGETDEHLRKKYIDNNVTQHPVFIFNADPVFILYTRGGTNPVIALQGEAGASDVQVIYFVRTKEGLKRTGGSMGSAFDDVFQSKLFVDAAAQEMPFRGWRNGSK